MMSIRVRFADLTRLTVNVPSVRTAEKWAILCVIANWESLGVATTRQQE